MTTAARSHKIEGLRERTESDMPRKTQDGKLLKRTDVKRPYWYIRVSELVYGADGEPKKSRPEKKCGFCDEVSREDAMRERRVQLDKANAHKTARPLLVRFSDVTQRYLSVRGPLLAASTKAWEETQIKNHINPAFGAMRLTEVNRLTIETWLSSKTSLSWWSRNGLKRILARLFNVAKEWEWWVGDNPVHGIRLGRKVVKYDRRLLSIEDFRRLLAHLEPDIRFAVLVIFGLGLRIGEVLGLKWKDIDFEARTIVIRRNWSRGNLSAEGVTKSEASSATLRLSEALLQEFRGRYPGPHRRDEFVFLGPDGVNPPDDRDWGRERFRPALKKLNLYTPGNLWHSVRRMHITYRQQIGGATPLEAMRAARHTSVDLTLLYTLSDYERETAQQQAMFETLLGTKEGKAN